MRSGLTSWYKMFGCNSKNINRSNPKHSYIINVLILKFKRNIIIFEIKFDYLMLPELKTKIATKRSSHGYQPLAKFDNP